VSKLDRSQAGIYRTKIGKIDVIAVSDGTVGLGLTKELIQNAKPGRGLKVSLARPLPKVAAGRFRQRLSDQNMRTKLVLIDAGSSETGRPNGWQTAAVPPSGGEPA